MPGDADGETHRAELPPDIVRIATRVPFRVPPANVYLFRGAEPTLVDTGCGTPEGWQDLVEGLASAGVDVADIARIVVSHHHVDHAGNAARLREASGAEVCVHKADAEPIVHWETHKVERNRAYGAGLRRAAVPEPILEKIARAGRAVDSYMSGCPVDRVLYEGAELRAGDRLLRVVHTPGHTAGSAVYVHEEGSIAATGDTLLERITPNAVTVRREEAGALETYLATLARLRGLRLGMVLPGHGLPFTGAEAVIDRAFAHYERRRARVRAILAGAPQGATVWDVVTGLWPEPAKGSAFLMVSEALGHLELLHAEDEVRVQESDGIARYLLST